MSVCRSLAWRCVQNMFLNFSGPPRLIANLSGPLIIKFAHVWNRPIISFIDRFEFIIFEKSAGLTNLWFAGFFSMHGVRLKSKIEILSFNVLL